MVLLDESQDVLMLVTNSLKGDLCSPVQFNVGLALTALGNIASQDMARDLASEVEKLLQSTNPYIRKKAALCSTRILRKNPDLSENFAERIKALVQDRNHGVLLAGITAMIELLDVAPQYIPAFRRLVPAIIRILKSLVLSGYAPEHDIYGITDPFLQVKLLRLLAVLGRGSAEASEQMSDTLAQVATNTEASKTAGNAILYEVVLTIMSIQSEQGLRVLAVNTLGRFLSSRDNNIRYVALNTLSRVVAYDVQAVQRHRATVIECLRDPDISIRRRALELAYALINESNIKVLARELINFLIVADAEFKPDLTTKICAVVDKYAPSPRWHVDTLVMVLTHAGDLVRDEIPASLVALVAHNPDVHEYAVRRLYHALRSENSQALVQVGLWCIGEFGDSLVRGSRGDGELDDPVTEPEVVALIRDVLASPFTTDRTREYALTALIKLTTRLTAASVPDITQLINAYRRSNHLDIQQRACEFSTLLTLNALRPALLEPMPVPDKPVLNVPGEGGESAGSAGAAAAAASSSSSTSAAASAAAAAPRPAAKSSSTAATASSSSPPQSKGSSDLLGLGDVFGDSAPATGSGGGGGGGGASSALDLLGVFGGGGGAPATHTQQSHTTQAAAPAKALTDANMLLDLIGGGPSNPPPQQQQQQQQSAAHNPLGDIFGGGGAPAPAPAPVAAAAPAGGSIVGFSKDGLTITFDTLKAPGNPSMTKITATFVSTHPTTLANFVFLAAVPKYIKMQLLPATSPELPPNSKVTQVINVANSLHGQKPVLFRIKLEFDRDGVHHVEGADVAFPAHI
jgi:AP-1 complex subunit gamma-1